MVTAIVLAQVKRGEINAVAQDLLKLDGVAEVYSVAGEWDLVIIVRVQKNEQVAEIVTDQMLKLEGLVKTETLIGFRAYSNYDLDRMFTLGLGE
ncbi:MAG TPA: Lrp/AsnC family transcriptional regulator [Candidatus Hydrogenedentes bacterium]|nr:Lrp/AsnC family transcriptional regulator [Candidatus Hydrogenedentota bacterium]